MTVCLTFQMVILSAYAEDGIHEKEIDAQYAKISGLNQHKEENVGFVSNLTPVCVSYFDFFSALSKEHSFVFFCIKVFCSSPRRLVMISTFLTLPYLLMLIITEEACKQMLLETSEFCSLTAAEGIIKHII